MTDTRSNKVRPSATYLCDLVLMIITDTLIVWTESNVTDMALSFQEPEGCAAIWCVFLHQY